MRLHGGFNEKQNSPPSLESMPKKRRPTNSSSNERRLTKRKRPNSPSTSDDNHMGQLSHGSMSIKNEQEDIMMMSSPSNSSSTNDPYQQSMYRTLPPCSDVLHHRSYDRLSSSRTRSISSSVIQPATSPLAYYNIKNPMSVQPVTNVPKPNRKQIPIPLYLYDKNNNHHYGFDFRTNEESFHNNRMHMANNTNNPLNIPGGILRFDHFPNTDIFSNVTMQHHHDEKLRKAFSADEPSKCYSHDRQVREIL